MPISKFITIESPAVPLPIENVDTDQIIPARFLKATTREGFGENLFRDWRYDNNNQPKEVNQEDIDPEEMEELLALEDDN